MKVGERVRLRVEVTTLDGVTHPAGSTGVIVDACASSAFATVDMDSFARLCVPQYKLEVFTPVFGGHYQPVVGVPDPVPVLDADAATMETNVTVATTEPEPVEGDYLAITRSFCR